MWTDTVKRGTMLRQVQGLGTPVRTQEEERQIPAESEATVVIRICTLPSKAGSNLMNQSRCRYPCADDAEAHKGSPTQELKNAFSL